MPTTFEVDHEADRVTITRTGEFALSDLVESVKRMHATGVWTYSVLVDARHANANLSTSDVRSLVSEIEHTGEPSRRGPIAVVTTDDTTYGMVRMFSMLTESIGMRVGAFQDLAEAEHWLNQESSLPSAGPG